jgi:hypothetical protein
MLDEYLYFGEFKSAINDIFSGPQQEDNKIDTIINNSTIVLNQFS